MTLVDRGDEVGVPFEQVRVVAGDSDSADGLRHRRRLRDDGRSDAAHRACAFAIAS